MSEDVKLSMIFKLHSVSEPVLRSGQTALSLDRPTVFVFLALILSFIYI